jgi:5'-methylthioadenosine nucleosidase
VVVIAMEAEAMPLIEHLKLEKDPEYFPPQTPFHAWNGTYNDEHFVTVVTNGKDTVYSTDVDNCGTVPASLASFLALQRSGYDLLVNAGTCGGFRRKGAGIGDVFLTTAVAHHDRRIPIPGFDRYGIGHLPSTFDPTSIANELGYKTGVCTTGNSLDRTPEDDALMLQNDASVKDMEAAAIAWSCRLFKVPFLGIKVVTDLVDGGRPTHEEFLENLHTASASLQRALPRVLDSILGRHHDEL